jgi:hypothetical protein
MRERMSSQQEQKRSGKGQGRNSSGGGATSEMKAVFENRLRVVRAGAVEKRRRRQTAQCRIQGSRILVVAGFDFDGSMCGRDGSQERVVAHASASRGRGGSGNGGMIGAVGT